MTRLCKTCREPFEPRGDWHKQCWSCWQRAKLDDAKRDARLHGFNAGFAAGKESSAPASVLGVDELRLLVRLTHPDVHPPERFELANRATAILNNAITQQKRKT